MRARRLLLVATLLTLAATCTDAPVAPTAVLSAAPSLNVSNGPDNLPNVIRFSEGFAFGVQDLKTDLVAFAGLPDDPKTSADCGGSASYAEADVQNSGVRQEVIHWLERAGDINLHVYTRSTFEGFCNSTPIATGVGHAWYVDNDRNISGSGANSWGFHMGGPVTLADGSTANLEAHNRWMISPDGVLRLIHREVKLSR